MYRNYKLSIVGEMLCITLVILFSYSCNSSEDCDIWSIDITQSYPSRKIIIQDVADISYIKLETDTTFLISSDMIEYLSESFVGFFNNQTGDILFFSSQTGEKAFMFNKRGGGPEEYLLIGAMTFDEIEKELYVWSIMDNAFKVYDTTGMYIKTLPLRNTKKGESTYITGVVDYNSNYLLCTNNHIIGYKENQMDYYESMYLLDKKRIGESYLLDSIPSNDIINIYLQNNSNGQFLSVSPSVSPIVSLDQDIVYNSCSIDTIFKIDKERNKTPFVIRRPSLKDQFSKTILRFDGETSEWIFLTSIKLNYDFEQGTGLNEKHFGISKTDKHIYEVEFVNKDDSEFSYFPLRKGGIYRDSFELIKAKEKGCLSGNLDNLCSSLSEDENGIILLIKEKK